MKPGEAIAVTERPPVKVCSLRYTGPAGEPLARFWRATVTPWLAEHGLLDCPRYGVSLDDPGETPADSCRYDACVELPAGLSLPEVTQTTIAGGRYAVTHFRGTAAEMGAAWQALVHTAGADPARHVDPRRPRIEHHPRGATHDPRTGAFACELLLPLVCIERAQREDAEAILELQKLAYRSEARLYHDWTLPPLTQTLAALRDEIVDGIVLKASDGERITGSVRARESGGACHVGRLIVHPEAQGRGIGTLLMHAIERAFPSATRFQLFTGSRSEGNLRLYRRLGYQHTHDQVLSPALTLIHLEKRR